MIVVFLLLWLANTAGLWLLSRLLEGIHSERASRLWLAGLVLTLANLTIRPLLAALALPLTVASFGLFSLVINALMLELAAALVRGFEIRGFGSALLGALLLSLFGLLVRLLLVMLMGQGSVWFEMHRVPAAGGTWF